MSEYLHKHELCSALQLIYTYKRSECLDELYSLALYSPITCLRPTEILSGLKVITHSVQLNYFLWDKKIGKIISEKYIEAGFINYFCSPNLIEHEQRRKELIRAIEISSLNHRSMYSIYLCRSSQIPEAGDKRGGGEANAGTKSRYSIYCSVPSRHYPINYYITLVLVNCLLTGTHFTITSQQCNY